MMIIQIVGRTKEHIQYIEDYMKANNLFRDYSNPEQDPTFTEVNKCVSYYKHTCYCKF